MKITASTTVTETADSNSKIKTTAASLLVRYSFILDTQNFDFLAAWAIITNQPKCKYHSQRDFYEPQVSLNCLAWTKGVKYKQIS